MTFNQISQNRRRGVILFFFLILFLIYLGGRLIVNFLSLKNYSEDINFQEEEIQKLTTANASLRELIDFLSSETAVSEYARIRLGMKQAGEEAVIITKDRAIKSSFGSDAKADDPATNRIKWFKYFIVN